MKLRCPTSEWYFSQQVSVYHHSFVSIIQSYDCKQVPGGLLLAEKRAEVVLVKVSKVGFPAYWLTWFCCIIVDPCTQACMQIQSFGHFWTVLQNPKMRQCWPANQGERSDRLKAIWVKKTLLKINSPEWNSGYTVKYNPLPWGVPSGFAHGNSFRQRVIFDRISLVSF